MLATVLTEMELGLNPRLVCAASDDPHDCKPLIPNHLLFQRTVHTLPHGSFRKEDVFVRKKWRQYQILADDFGRDG